MLLCLQIPPVTNNTREDDKPLPKTVREGIAVRKTINTDSAVNKEKRRQAKIKAQQKQDKEAKNATAPLGDSDDDKPLVQPKNKPAPKAKAKAKAARTDDSDDDKPLVQPKNKPAPKAKPKAKSAIDKEKARQSRVRAQKREEPEVVIEAPPPIQTEEGS